MGKFLPPEVIQACVLRKLRAEIVARLGQQARVVITVPAYFDEARRKGTADAGEIAGLNVIDIVNEPTAAALAFGEGLGYLTPDGGAKAPMTILVYDLGGGTFDTTLLRLAPGDIRTLATDGDVQLGGYDWDLRLVDYAAASFARAFNLDPRTDRACLNRLIHAASEAKHTLSTRSRASMRVEFQGKASEVQVTREQFEEMTADLLERTRYTTRQLFLDAQVDPASLDRVLLVGGSTRMPMVAAMVKELTGLEPDRTVNPDEAVARGAAIYAAYRLAKGRSDLPGPRFEVTQVNAHSLGVEGIDPQTMRKANVTLIPRNSALPAKVKERFATKTDNQQSIVLQVLEGESSLPGECTAIGRTVIRDIPAGLTKGWPVEVTFEYGSNGRLRVEGTVPGTHQKAKLELVRATGLNSVGIARWKHPVESSAGFDLFESVVQQELALVPNGGVTPSSGFLSAPGSLHGDVLPQVPLPVPPLPPAAAMPHVPPALPAASSPSALYMPPAAHTARA
ncbi:MAG: Hsp70 family protein, partial [Patescibacteria group bacterium]|nr:Hsp70 family protein [Patescibacteria group bacterium]